MVTGVEKERVILLAKSIFVLEEFFKKSFSSVHSQIKRQVHYQSKDYSKEEEMIQNYEECYNEWEKQGKPNQMKMKRRKESNNNNNDKEEEISIVVDSKSLFPEEHFNEEAEEKKVSIPIDWQNEEMIEGEMIGQGAYGFVYRMQPKSFPVTVVAKCFSKLRDPTNAKTHFNKEKSIMEKLSHQNIAQYFGCREESNQFTIFMCQYDRSLRKVIDKKLKQMKSFGMGWIKDRWFDNEEICDFSLQILNGINYLHSNLIAHLDLKVKKERDIFLF